MTYVVVRVFMEWGLPVPHVWTGDDWLKTSEWFTYGKQPKEWYSYRSAADFAAKQKLDRHETVKVMPTHELKTKSSYYD